MILKKAPRKAGTRDRLLGLLAYLAGPGRAEEHTDQRIVAGWDESCVDIALRDPGEQRDLAGQMEAPARLREMEPPKDGFVYHVPISLHPDDPRLSDEQWAYVARKAIAKLGFEDCRWVAVHHGMAHSEQGPRDHIHLVVHRAREDGTVAGTWNDYRKMAALRAELEDDPTLGLVVKTQRQGGGRSGWTHGERDRADRAGQTETDRERLERLVRAAVGPAASEADWVQAMRTSGVLARPRYAVGGQSEVVGYSVALAPETGQDPVWYGGGKLAKDLTLPAVRRRWDGHDPAEAVPTWAAATQSETPTQQPRRPRGPGGPVSPQVAAQRQQASDALAAFEQTMAATPLGDTGTWRAYARETAEVLAVLSAQAPASDRDALARSARQLARAAETSHGQPRGHSTRAGHAVRAACRIITSGALAGQGGMATVLELTRQLQNLSAAIGRAQQARQDAAAARQASNAAREVYGLHQRLSQAAQQRRQPQPTHPAQLAAAAHPDPAQQSLRKPATGPRRTAARRPQQPGRDDDRGHGR